MMFWMQDHVPERFIIVVIIVVMMVFVVMMMFVMVLMVMVMMFMIVLIFLDFRKQVPSGYDDIQQFFNGIITDRF